MSAISAVVILGLARQGKALARFFAGQGWRVTVSDARSEAALRPAVAELAEFPVHYVLGEHPSAYWTIVTYSVSVAASRWNCLSCRRRGDAGFP